MMAIGAMLVKFFGTPLGRWIVIVALVASALFAGGVYERNIGYQEATDKAIKQRQAEENAYLGIVAATQTAFHTISGKYDALKQKAELDAKLAAEKLTAALAKQKARLIHDLTPAAVARCPDLPFGYLVHRFNAAHQVARGDDATAPEPAGESAAASTGVSIADLAQLDDDQAGAYKACRERVSAWEKREAAWQSWLVDVNNAISTAVKGSP